MKIINWFIKQLFYIRYFLDRGYSTLPSNIVTEYPEFESTSFLDNQWNQYLEWYLDSKHLEDWNTFKYRQPWHQNNIKGFSRRYGKFFFNCRLAGLIDKDGRPAIWLLELQDKNDQYQREGFENRTFYYEIDIELFEDSLEYTLHLNHNGKQHEEPGYQRWSAGFQNKSLWNELRNSTHLYTINWSPKWIKFYIDNILTAVFRNDYHIPMQIVMSRLTMQRVIVFEP